jgi:hypothetical protein
VELTRRRGRRNKRKNKQKMRPMGNLRVLEPSLESMASSRLVSRKANSCGSAPTASPEQYLRYFMCVPFETINFIKIT